MYAWLFVHLHTYTLPMQCVYTCMCTIHTYIWGEKGKNNITPNILVLTFKESDLLLIKVKQREKMNLSMNKAQAKRRVWILGRTSELDFTMQPALAPLFSHYGLIITFCSSGRHCGRYFRVNSRVSATEEHPRGVLWSIPKAQHMESLKPPSYSFSHCVCGSYIWSLKNNWQIDKNFKKTLKFENVLLAYNVKCTRLEMWEWKLSFRGKQ